MASLSDSFLSSANWWLGWISIIATLTGLLAMICTHLTRTEISRRQGQREAIKDGRISSTEQKLVSTESKLAAAEQASDAAHALARRLELRMQPRHLADQQRTVLSAILSQGPKGRVVICAVKMDPEATEFSSEIGEVLSACGFSVEPYSGPLLLSINPGQWIAMRSFENQPPFAGRIQTALRAAGIECEAYLDDKLDQETLMLGIGQRPTTA